MPDTGAPWEIPFLDGTELVRAYPAFSEDLADQIAAGLSASAGVVQVVVATDATERTTTSTDFVNANIQASITPKDAANLLVVVWSCNKSAEQISSSGTFRGMRVRVVEVGGSPVPGLEDNRTERRLVSASGDLAWVHFDTTHIGVVVAGSTAARTYRGEFLARSDNRAYVQRGENSTGVLAVIEIDGTKVA